MPYLYSLLGITAWVMTVALSSNALIAHENTLQAESVKKKVELYTKKSEIIKPAALQPVVTTSPTVSITQKDTPVTSVTQESSQNVSPKVKTVVTPVKRYEHEEDDDDN